MLCKDTIIAAPQVYAKRHSPSPVSPERAALLPLSAGMPLAGTGGGGGEGDAAHRQRLAGMQPPSSPALLPPTGEGRNPARDSRE